MKWVMRWKYEISAKPVLPGVWRRKDGGFLVRGRATDRRTGKRKEILRVIEGADPALAFAALQAELTVAREGAVPSTPPLFSAYALSLMERKIREGTIRSAAGRVQYAHILEKHLLPTFGPLRVDQVRRADILAWRDRGATLVKSGTYSPRSVNGWLSNLLSILRAAVAEYELERDPTRGVEPLPTVLHPAYTDEEPNSLTTAEVAGFLSAVRARFPQHFAMVCLGLATGLRPSSLRPLRRKGPTPDILWDTGELLIRQSHTRKQEVMPCTKTGTRQRITLPQELVDILRRHAENLPPGTQQESNLLFPNPKGAIYNHAALQRVFTEIDSPGLNHKHITPRAMRRTFQDLAREAAIEAIVTRSISGHATAEMQDHYSTVKGEEQRAGLAKVISLGGFREALGGGKGGGNPEAATATATGNALDSSGSRKV